MGLRVYGFELGWLVLYAVWFAVWFVDVVCLLVFGFGFLILIYLMLGCLMMGIRIVIFGLLHLFALFL